jgi:uracil-DNA glycosylase family protein
VFALVSDAVHAASGSAIWQTVATLCVAGGIVGALLATVPGLIDYLSLDEAEMRRIANLQLAVNFGARIVPKTGYLT